jgi:hypothetical protein
MEHAITAMWWLRPTRRGVKRSRQIASMRVDWQPITRMIC